MCPGADGFVVVHAPATVGDNQTASPPVAPVVLRLLTIPKVVTNPSAPDAIVSVTIPSVVAEYPSLVAIARLTFGRLPCDPDT